MVRRRRLLVAAASLPAPSRAAASSDEPEVAAATWTTPTPARAGRDAMPLRDADGIARGLGTAAAVDRGAIVFASGHLGGLAIVDRGRDLVVVHGAEASRWRRPIDPGTVAPRRERLLAAMPPA